MTSPSNLRFTQQLATFTHLSLLLLHLFLAPCFSHLLRVPLRRATGRLGSRDDVDRSRRAVNEVTQPMEGISGEGYFINISIGTPPQEMQILVDTGSSNLALAASAHPHISHFFNNSESSTYSETSQQIYVPYTQGEWQGVLGTDVVTLTSLANVTFHPNIAFITESTGFFIPESNWQGIVGLAYQSIARPNTLKPFWDTLRDEASLDDVFSMQLCGTAFSHSEDKEAAMEGNLVFGGIVQDLYSGPIFYSPIVKEMYYEVIITDIGIDGKSLALDCKEYNFDKSIVDSGTTHLRLPTLVFHKVVEKMKHSVEKNLPVMDHPRDSFWNGEDWLCWDDLTKAFKVFPTVSLSLLSSTNSSEYFTLHLTAQHYLRNVKTDEDKVRIVSSTKSCLKFGISPSESGSVLGALLMESFYVVFDRQKQRMGFAASTCPPPSVEAKSPGSLIEGPHRGQGNLTSCQYQRAVDDDSSLVVMTYVMAAVCVVCALPLCIVIVQWQVRKWRQRRSRQQDPEAETVLTDSR